MKKTGSYLIILSMLVVMCAWLLLRNDKPSEEEQKAFNTPDIAALSAIELKDRQGNFSSLSKEGQEWLLEDRFQVSKITLNDLLYALEHMEVAYAAPSVAIDNVLKQMISNSTKVSLFRDGEEEPYKVFVVGGPNHDQDGTYMIMELDGKAADRPYLVKLPGFKGYITYRFTAIRSHWVGKQFTHVLADEIKRVSLEYFQVDSLQSFDIIKTGNDYTLLNGVNQQNSEDLNLDLLNEYFSGFRNLSFERFLDSIPNQDSIVNHLHFADLSIDLNSGDTKKISIYFKPFPRQENLPLDDGGGMEIIDQDKLYAFDHSNQSFYTIQYYTFGKLFAKADQFNL
ncbi:DUF4340 domain-containing protein [Chitinophagales bacterium]|nr:DUF4340 domain-containing protein [Chitinophagales bacterium]